MLSLNTMYSFIRIFLGNNIFESLPPCYKILSCFELKSTIYYLFVSYLILLLSKVTHYVKKVDYFKGNCSSLTFLGTSYTYVD